MELSYDVADPAVLEELIRAHKLADRGVLTALAASRERIERLERALRLACMSDAELLEETGKHPLTTEALCPPT